MGDRWNRQTPLDAKVQMLMDNFDSGIFLDETGDFKYTNPDVKAVIHRDDVDHLGNAAQNQQRDHLKTVHGFNTEDLIEIQNIKLTEDIPEPLQIQALGSTVSSKASPTGSQPHNEEQTSRQTVTHKEYKYRNQNFRSDRQPTRQPLQQQRIWQGQGLINRPPPPFQAPFWSPTMPPPQYGNQYQFSAAPPRMNPNIRYGYPNNSPFQNNQVYNRAFNPQTLQRRQRPNAQSFHSTNEFKNYK